MHSLDSDISEFLYREEEEKLGIEVEEEFKN